jgi:uncharacterized membrane protein
MTLTWPIVSLLAIIFGCALTLTILKQIPPAVITGMMGTLFGWLLTPPRIGDRTRSSDRPAGAP